MVGKLDIVNGALGLCGGERLASLPPVTNHSTVVSRSRWAMTLYDQTYEKVLGAWPFNDCRRRRQATKHGDAPAFDYSGKYELKPEVLRVVAVRSCGYPWEREGRFVLCSSGQNPIDMVTIERVAEEQLMGALSWAVSTALAHAISMAINDSQNRQDARKADAKDALLEACMSDNWEVSSQQMATSGWWLAARTSYAPEDMGAVRPGRSWLEA